MNYTKTPYLCGGVLLLLLEQTKPEKGSAQNHIDGICDDHTNPIVLRDLIYVFTDSKNYYAQKDCSKYSNCLSEGSINVPFNDSAIISAFDTTVRSSYPIALERMQWFVDTHIKNEPGLRLWLVKALLDIIENDDDIDDEEQFYCLSNGSSVEKAELIGSSTICLDSFLLGVLHYILQHRTGKNDNGKATLSIIAKKKGNGREYVGTLGNSISREITINRYDPDIRVEEDAPHQIETSNEETNHDAQSDDDVIIEPIKNALGLFAEHLAKMKHDTAEKIRDNRRAQEKEKDKEDDPECIDVEDIPADSEPSLQQNITIIQNQTNIENNETNNFNINNSNVTFDLRRK